MAELPQKHRVSVSGVLKILGVSRSGYRAWKQRVPSVSEKHRDHIKDAIKQIYDGSHQNYGAPKITEMLHRQGESIAEKTVGNYMRQMGIKAQWVKPYTVTTIDSDFNSELQNILDEQFNPDRPNTVWCSDITYIKREWLNRFKIHDYKQAYRLIFEYLEAFYNTKRIHSHCNYMSPNEFERLYKRTHTEAELLAG